MFITVGIDLSLLPYMNCQFTCIGWCRTQGVAAAMTLNIQYFKKVPIRYWLRPNWEIDVVVQRGYRQLCVFGVFNIIRLAFTLFRTCDWWFKSRVLCMCNLHVDSWFNSLVIIKLIWVYLLPWCTCLWKLILLVVNWDLIQNLDFSSIFGHTLEFL